MAGATDLREKENLYGFWCMTGHAAVVDAAASVTPDFIVIDTQHGVDLGQVDASSFTVMDYYGVPGLVRVPSIDIAPIGRALDLGAAGIIVPLIESAADAERAVAATRHAPEGGRSYGMQTRRVDPFDEEPFVVVQVETAGAIRDIEAIAGVAGVDALYIGPADLGLALGGEPAPDVDTVFEGTHPNGRLLAEAFGAVVAAGASQGVAAGLHCGSGASARRARAAGFTMASVAVDLALIGAGLAEQLGMARQP